jgi:hypothetical protein
MVGEGRAAAYRSGSGGGAVGLSGENGNRSGTKSGSASGKRSTM